MEVCAVWIFLVLQQYISARVSSAAEVKEATAQKWKQRNRKLGSNEVQELRPDATEWTSWFNIDHPGGNGDFERLEAIRFYYRERLCARPAAMEARTTDWVKAEHTGEVVHHSPDRGFWCVNKEQPHGRICSNYHIRFRCPVVHNRWSQWSEWSPCSAMSCGAPGVQARQRTCANNLRFRRLIFPRCKGKAIEKRKCTMPACQEARWSEWASWTACSVSCGSGHSLRHRNCIRTAGGQACVGRTTEVKRCTGEPCSECPHACRSSGVGGECRGCVCAQHMLAGTVRSTDGAAISGSTVATVEQPLVTLAMTDHTGWFHIDGVCSHARTHLLVQHRKYAPSVFHSVQNSSETSIINATLTKLESPYIVKHPESKVRFEDQQVVFCCRATGAPTPLKYFWYHNGTQLDTEHDRTLTLRKLKRRQGGVYQCNSTNGFGSILSAPATLTVIAKGQPSCRRQPLERLIKLPGDCLQAASGTLYHNVGRCPSLACAGSLDDELRCKDGKGYCCGVKRIDLREIPCQGYTLPVKVVTECGCQRCQEPRVSVRGQASAADDGEPLRFGQIYIGGEQVGLTGYRGTFTIPVPAETDRLVVRFVDGSGKFVDTVKVFPFDRRSGAVYFQVKLLRKSEAIEVDSTQGVTIPLGEMRGQDTIGELEIPANSFRRRDGQPYSGKVKASVTFLDPRNISLAMAASSDLNFVDQRGDVKPLRTYGMFTADFREQSSGLPLDAEGVRVYLDTASVKMPEHVRQMRLWSLNPDTGFWEEESTLRAPGSEGGKRRNKREERTFLVGNLEIRERRLFNLDVPESRRCYVKVRAYMSDKFLPGEQLEGVVVSLINLEPLPGYKANPRAWGRFDSVITGPNGACLPAFCDAERPDAYTAYVTATLSAEELEAAPSAPKMNPNVVGVPQPLLAKLEYRRSDHEDEQLKKTAFKINLPKPSAEEGDGPIYPYQNMRQCEDAPVSSNHFRFYKVEVDKYEYNVVPFQEDDLTSWVGDHLSWWPNPQEFRACYIKVRVSGPEEVMVRSRNSGGNHPDTTGKLYGIRDSRSVRDLLRPNVSSACVEFKCGGMLFDQSGVDRTLVTVTPQGSCRHTATNSLLREYLRRHPPHARHGRDNDTTAFSMLAPVDPLGHNYGIYTVTDQNPRLAKEIAIGRCFHGTSDGFSRAMKVDAGTALTFTCMEKAVSRQSLFQRLQNSPTDTVAQIGAEMRRLVQTRPGPARVIAYPSVQRNRRTRAGQRRNRPQ
ncbi:LOW QUALITY PROTEIN: cartilage intermediate layer protein 1-like [Leucoraja erinacea]|uniref:LOW QUALITY PROTEIN: cartilage intermediate layer protein 1-like n=1 Tax=Leucoraja erinaceus TaxID=7782 RepID=UPI00245710D0|nr:LOW QUALITY PROTEIN: cartilage intermediate layer protein 1-like [Leucoraja erinacea]